MFTPEDENYSIKTFDLEVNVVNCATDSGEHEFTEWQNSDNEHWLVCAKCKTEKPGSRENHKGGTATCQAKAKCSECGEEYGNYGEHNWDDEWTTDSEKHWHKCLNSGCTEINNDNPHSGGTATCKDKAKCENCDMAYGKLGAHGKTEIKNAKDATCTTDGYTGDTYCKVCGEKIADGTKIDALGHGKTEVKNAKKATCTADGYTGDTYCKVCNQKIADGDKIAATGHLNKETRNKKEATCTQNGNTGDIWCKDCNTKLEKGTVIAAIGHNYENGKCKACGTADPNYKPTTNPSDNSKSPQTGDNSKTPQTGDNSNVALWLALLFVSGMGIVATTAVRRKKRMN